MKDKKIKILFVLKKRAYDRGVSYGLSNSVRFVGEALVKESKRIDYKIVTVLDGNGIDKEVHDYNPTHVFLEAIWCPADKLEQLLKLYPKVEWFVRIHSKVEFLAHEGTAFQYLKEYAKLDKKFKNFKVCFNNKQTVEDVKESLDIKSKYAPNIYLFKKNTDIPNYSNKLKIGCLGALREFKNHINQALASIEFANKNGYIIEFHINVSTDYEKHGENILKNLRNLFKETPHKLVEHPWMNHADFIELVKTMDLGLQVSYSETFCIVAADFVSQNIPLVGSEEIEFLDSWYHAKPCDVRQIAQKIEFAYLWSYWNLQRLNERGLNKHNEKAIEEWLDLLD